MTRVTKNDLEVLVNRINTLTGSPETEYTKTDAGYRANPGNYHLSWAYGGVSLERMCNDSGGVTSILSGYCSKPEMYQKLHAFLRGIDAAK